MAEGITNIMYDDIMVSLPCIAATKRLYISHNCYYHYRVRNDSLKREYRQDEVITLVKSYPDFYKRFKGSIIGLEGDKQIKYFAMYWLLYRAPHAFDNPDEDEFLTPFGGFKITDKIIIYGAGAAGIHIEQYIRNIVGINIVCWADHNFENLQKTLNVVNPNEIANYKYDYVIISIMRGSAVLSSKKELVSLGVPEEKYDGLIKNIWIIRTYC